MTSPAHGSRSPPADLRPVDLFDDLDDAALAEWAAVAQWREAEAGEIVVEPGTTSRRG